MNPHYPAFPADEHVNDLVIHYKGFTKHELACVLLKVPSGEEHLDALIRKANRREMATTILAGLASNTNLAGSVNKHTKALDLADALLDKLEEL